MPKDRLVFRPDRAQKLIPNPSIGKQSSAEIVVELNVVDVVLELARLQFIFGHIVGRVTDMTPKRGKKG